MKRISRLVREARSYRNFDGSVSISRELLTELVDMARLTASGANLQPLKYLISCDKERNEQIFSLTNWAGRLRDRKLPDEGCEPTAYIVICTDLNIVPNSPTCRIDVGIAAQTIMLGAAEADLGGCFLGNFDEKRVKEALGIPAHLSPQLMIALGKPAEEVRLCTLKETEGDVAYFRDENDVHVVPKRALEEIIISG